MLPFRYFGVFTAIDGLAAKECKQLIELLMKI
jgi:hypothetical protein